MLKRMRCVWRELATAPALMRRSSLLAVVVLIAHSLQASGETVQASTRRGITTRDLATLKEVQSMSVSPDGRHVAYQIYQPDIDANAYRISWYTATIDSPTGGARPLPLSVADGGEPVFFLLGMNGGGRNGQFDRTPAIWSPDSTQFAYPLNENGEIQLWISQADRPGRWQLTHNEADVRYATWSKNGARIYFAVDRKRSELHKLRQEQMERGALVRADAFAASIDAPEPPPCTDEDLDEDYRERILGSDSRACKVQIWTIDLQTRQERLASSEESREYQALTADQREERERLNAGAGARRMVASSRDGRRQAWVENVDPRVFQGYFPPQRVAASVGGKDVSCTADICRSLYFQDLWWSDDDREVIALAQTPPRMSMTSLYRWRPDTDEVTVVRKTEEELISNCHRLPARLICIRVGWTSPATIASVDLTSGEATTLVDPNPEFAKIGFTRVESRAWKDAYGNTAVGHLVYPRDYRAGARYPLIITTYVSGGFLKGAAGDEQPIHVYAQNGFFVLSFNVPEDEENDAKTADPVQASVRSFAYPLFKQGPSKALDTLLDELDRRGMIDPRRVGITGFSYGANIVDTALVFSRRYAAASTAWSPVSPAMSSFYTSGQRKVGELLYGGDAYGAGLKKWRETAIAFNAEKINVPYLIQAADREYFVSLQNFMALANAGKPVEMYRFPDEYHVKWQPAHRYAIYNRNVDWFNFWLRDVESGLTGDPEQYPRWRELRKQRATEPPRQLQLPSAGSGTSRDRD